MATTSKSSADLKPEPSRTKWEKLLAYTPVVLTVLATLLAGLSTSEMTQAQYHRSLAAQNQSKAGDQWGFFQAKRIRGTSMDATADVISSLAEPGAVDAQRLVSFHEQLLADADQLRKEAGKMAEGGDRVPPAAVGELRAAAQRAYDNIARTQASFQATVNGADAARAIGFMVAGTVPKVEDRPLEDQAIMDTAAAIGARKPESATEPYMRLVTPAALAASIEISEGNAHEFDEVCTPVVRRLNTLNRILAEQVQHTRALHRAVRDFNEKLDAAGVAADSTLRRTAAPLARLAENDKTRAAEMYADFLAARHRFNAVRYERDAAYNSKTANLYEVQVRKSNWNSERHRRRSTLFFFGMLAAQAGVTIASLALAVRMQSLMWGLASVAGLAAVAIAVVVYCFV